MIGISEKEFHSFSQFIEKNYGIHLGPHKKSLLEARLHSILNEKNFHSFSELYDYILLDRTGEAVTLLINKITTNHTYFMREHQHFHYFKNCALPFFYSKQKQNKDLRIWSAGCATGEEAYTLAMIVSDYFGEEKKIWDTKILATDISKKALLKAQEGIYTEEQLSFIPRQWKNKYFEKLDLEKRKINDFIRNEVVFRRFNLINEKFPFKKKFHIIFCRNVMIYFDNKTKEQLIQKFYENTERGGYLFIGHSETIDLKKVKYRYIMPAIYRKE